MYQFYLQTKPHVSYQTFIDQLTNTTNISCFEKVEGYQLLNGLAAYKLKDQTWTIIDVLSGTVVIDKQYTLLKANEVLNSDEMKARIEKARSFNSYKILKKAMYDYVMGLEEKDRVEGWKRYVRGNK